MTSGLSILTALAIPTKTRERLNTPGRWSRVLRQLCAAVSE